MPTTIPCGHEVLHPEQVHYCDYLSLNPLLSLSLPFASTKQRDVNHPDELMFVGVHQVFEMLFQLQQHELRRLIGALQKDDLDLAIHQLKRIIAFTKIYTNLMMTMVTMKSEDFAAFRDGLSPASGAESEGFRLVEILSGIRADSPYAVHLKREYTYREFHDRAPKDGPHQPKTRWWTKKMTALVQEPSVETAFEGLMQRRELTLQDVSEDEHARLAEVIDLLNDYDNQFHAFRMAHVKVVDHQVGTKPGTGHTEGAMYLLAVADRARFYPEIHRWKKYVKSKSK